MKLTREEIYGYAGSFLFCGLLLLILWFSVLKTIIPGQEEGILVNFGNVDEGAGMFEPRNTGEITQEDVLVEPVDQIEPVPSPPVEQVAMTQDIEESVAIEAAKKEEEKKKEQIRREQEEQRRKAEEERKRQEEEQRRRQAISNQVAGAFGAGSASSASQGTGTGTGNQGSPQGNSDQGANTGVGGHGEFSLAGRSLGPGGLPRPSSSFQEEGRIVIDITVDRNGNVILANIGKGTNIDSNSMRKSALEAARKAKFNAISGNENQSGTITYKYNFR